jgi:hypothetical protein
MLVVETIAKIRRAYFVHGQPIKAIYRELGVSRKVVRKVIRSEATEFRYERETQPLPKMGPWSAGGEREQDDARTADADPLVRRASRPRICQRLRRGSSLCAAVEPRAWRLDDLSLCAVELCARRSLPV